MELAPIGRLVAWLGLSLLIVGFILSNTPILLSSALLLLCVLLEGISFHRAIVKAKESIKLESYPSRIETTVGRQVRIDNVLANQSHSRFHISGFSLNLPPQIDGNAPLSLRILLGSNGVQHMETILWPKLPGNFQLTTSTILLADRGCLFRHSLRIRDKVVILAHPFVSQSGWIETSVFEDLTVDHLRRGIGTDLAGIRPFNFRDDFRRIDWKSTARTGKLMTKESYIEKDPTVILMVDASLITSQAAISPGLLTGIEDLLTAIRPTSPVGLILYDERKVLTNMEAAQGVINMERIRRTLLERVKNTSASPPLERVAISSYADLARETDALMKESVLIDTTKAHWRRLISFASFVLPFYNVAESKYFERVKEQGVFKAFEIVCNLPEPTLVIVIAHRKTKLVGLAEGAKNARTLNHQVVVLIPAAYGPTRSTEILSSLRDQGVGILMCPPEELSKAIANEIPRLTRNRANSVHAFK